MRDATFSKPLRYKNQVRHNTCGPVALFNAHLWQTGHEGELDQWIEMCQPNDEFGTPSARMPLDSFPSFNPIRLKKWVVHDGCGLILLCKRQKEKAHYLFLYCRPGTKQIVVLNAIKAKGYGPKLFRTWEQFEKQGYLDKSFYALRGEQFPCGWRIDKKETQHSFSIPL